MPWGHSPGRASGTDSVPVEIYGGYCVHRALVGFWPDAPTPQQLRECAAVEVRRIGVREMQRDIGRLCQQHPETWSLAGPKEEEMGLVKGGEPIDPAPEGLHRAVCVDNYTREKVATKYGEKDMEQFVFEIEELNPKNENKPYLVFTRFTASIGPKSSLTQFLESWRGQKFTKEDRAKGFDCEKVVGACCQIQIVHNHKDDGDVYANINAIMPLAKGQEKLKPSGAYVRFKDRDGKGAAAPADPDDDLPF